MTFGSWFRAHGLHVTQTTASLTSGLFSRTTKTPTTPFENQVRPDGAQRKELDYKKKQEAVKDSEMGHRTYNAANLKEHVADLQLKNGWLNVLKNEQQHLFPGSNPAQIDAFKSKMAYVSQHLSDDLRQTPAVNKRPREARVLPGTTMTVLMNAASTACNRARLNAEEAANAIACLHHIDLLAAIAAPLDGAGGIPNIDGNAHPRPENRATFNRQDVANAWRIAIELERSGEAGFNLLKHLMHKPAAPGHTVHVTVARQRDALLHTYLQAAREKVLESNGETPTANMFHNGLLNPDPRSVHSHINQKLGGNAGAEPGANPNDGGVHQRGVIGGRVLPANANAALTATLLDKAVKAVANHMQQVQTHAGNANNANKQITFDRNRGDIRQHTNPNTVQTLNKDCNWWAANAVRNGIYSENSKQYRKLQNRAEKMVTWLHRANNNNTAAGLTRWGRVQRTLTHALRPSNNKSPLHSYNAVAVNSPHRLKAGTDASGIADGQTMRQNLIWNLEKAIKQHGTPPVDGGAGTPLATANFANNHPVAAKRNQAGAVPDNPADPKVLTQMIRLAILKMQYRFNEKGNGATMFISRHTEGDQLVELDIERAKDEVYEMFAGGKAAQTPMTKGFIDTMFQLENTQISPETMIRWAEGVGAPPELGAALRNYGADLAGRNAAVVQAIQNFRTALPPGPQWNQPDWEQFVDGVERTLLGRVKDFANEGVDLTALTDTQVAQLFEDVISRQKLGHSMIMRDGAWTGFKTQGLSYLLSFLTSGGTQNIGLDLRYSGARQVELNFGTGTGGRDMFFGTVKAHRTQAGGGYSKGWGHLSKKAAGLTFGAAVGGNFTPFSGEWADKVGNLFRFRRVFSGVDSDDIGNKQLGRLMRKLMDPTTNPAAGEGGPWTNPADPNDTDILKQVLHEFDDVSVGWLKSKDQVFKESVSGSIGGGISAGAWGSFVGVGVGAELTQSKTTWREQGGSLNQERDIRATETKLTANGLLSFVSTTIANLNLASDPDLKGLLDPHLWSGVFKMTFHDGLVASADVARAGTSRRHTWIYHDGALTYTPGICSFYQKTHKNAASYVANVVKKLERLAHDKAKVFEAPRYYHGGQAANNTDLAGAYEKEQIRMIEQEMKKLLQDLHTALTTAKPTQEFREYYEWSPRYLQMINDLESLIRSEKAKPNWEANKLAKKRVKDYEKQLAKLKDLDDETVKVHGEYRFNIKDNVEFKTKNKGLNTTLLHHKEDLFRATRIDMYH